MSVWPLIIYHGLTFFHYICLVIFEISSWHDIHRKNDYKIQFYYQNNHSAISMFFKVILQFLYFQYFIYYGHNKPSPMYAIFQIVESFEPIFSFDNAQVLMPPR